jgi:hypothetical protein
MRPFWSQLLTRYAGLLLAPGAHGVRRMQVGWRRALLVGVWCARVHRASAGRARRTVNLVGYPAMGPAKRPSDAGTTCMARWETTSRNRDRLGHPRSPLHRSAHWYVAPVWYVTVGAWEVGAWGLNVQSDQHKLI